LNASKPSRPFLVLSLLLRCPRSPESGVGTLYLSKRQIAGNDALDQSLAQCQSKGIAARLASEKQSPKPTAHQLVDLFVLIAGPAVPKQKVHYGFSNEAIDKAGAAVALEHYPQEPRDSTPATAS
jgi:hypothetical protein